MTAKAAPINSYNLEGWRLALARVAVIFFGALALFVFMAATSYRSRQLTAIGFTNAFVLQTWNLGPELIPNFVLFADVVLFSTHFFIAGLLFIRRSKDRLVLFACVMLMCMGATITRPGDAVRSMTDPWMQTAYLVLYTTGLLSVCIFLHLFPNPTFIPRWSGVLALGYCVMMVGWYFVITNTWPVQQMPVWMIGSWIISGIALQIWRYTRISDMVRRQQTKWVIYGLSCAAVGFLTFNFVVPAVYPWVLRPGNARVVYVLLGVAIEYAMFMALPISFALSVLRYRLWDVDRIAFRAIVYSGLTAGIAILYFTTVLVLQQIFREITRTSSVIGVVVSTIAFGLLFNPIRQRAQELIERRTFHRKYNAALTLARFSNVAQHEVDIDKLTNALVSSVDEAMQPEHVSIWVKKREA